VDTSSHAPHLVLFSILVTQRHFLLFWPLEKPQTCSRACRYTLLPTGPRPSKLTGTSQRIRGAIDARIAEEQAKQRTTPSVPPRAGAARQRSTSRNLSPSKRTARSKDADSKAAPTGKGPDPSEFDPEFVIGEEDDQPSRSGTPKPKEKAPAAEATAEATAGDGSEEKTEPDGQAAEGEDKSDKKDSTEKAPEIPAEVKTRLRRLDKLEPKYSGV
jgi:hypothetical protein